MTDTRTSTTTAATEAVAEEQEFHDRALRRREDLLREIDATESLVRPRARTDATEHARLQTLLRRRAALEASDDGVVLGRLDGDDGAIHRIGRVGIPAADGDPLVLDWRAAAARPFYTATPVEPQGLRRRRHVRTAGRTVVGVDDEELSGDGADGLVGEAALLAALGQRRTGRMGTAVATLQREQDAIVRADAEGALVVQGGPGTGKTVVALHRVAYLLFSHPALAARGVLVLGPTRRFLDYIGQVLPALGETAVVASTCSELVPGVRVDRTESRALAEIKGRALWQEALARHVAGLVPDPAPLAVVVDGEQVVLEADRVARALRTALAGGRSLAVARARAVDALQDALVDVVAGRTAALLARTEEGLEDLLSTVDAQLARRDDRGARTRASAAAVDGVLSEADVEDLRSAVRADRGVRDALARWWPALEPAPVLAALLGDTDALRRHAVGLSQDEIAAVVAEPVGVGPSDVALLDAVTALLGDGPGTPSSGPDEPFLADRAAADRGWVYGHVVVDEAQELSAMQWQMVLRRCPTRSITAVGDVDQTSAPHRHTTWEDAVGPVLGDRWRRADLTICYRTPREVMELVGPVLARAGSTGEPPRAVRETGVPARERVVAGSGLARAAAREAVALAERYDGGTVGVVAPASWVEQVRDAVREVADGVSVVTPTEAKGLEWDATVVVDPDGIEAAPRGANALYVALTRCTAELVQLRVG